jgi:type I restriction enzyme M protein
LVKNNSNKSTNGNKKFRKSLTGNNGEEFNLENYLFESANILRGHVDASDFKAYIFPLLFYKRLSDVYDEEYQKALEESNNDTEYAESEVNHRFQIPKGCHWEDLRKKTKNIGEFLQKSLRSIEKSNPVTLYGVFGDTNWANKEKITDELMTDLIEHFSKVNLSNSKTQHQMLGDAYEYLIKKFADLQNKKAGEFYTPRTVVSLLTHILDPNDSETIYDPACGTGGMLLEAASQIKEKGQDIRKLKLYGQESNLNTAAIAKINLFLHGLDDFKIVRGDTLREPAFAKDDKLTKFDCVIANPPFSLKNWGYEIWKNDPYNRKFAGLPPNSFGDFAWVQHMISSMKDETGRVGVVLSSGALFRTTEKTIRQKIIEEYDYLDAVIQLGPNIFYGTSIAPCILIFKAKKKSYAKQNVFMINASDMYESGRAQNYLHVDHAKEIHRIYKKREEIDHVSKVVPVSEIRENDWNLNVNRYIEPKPMEEIIPIQQATTELKDAIKAFLDSEKNLAKILKKEGLLHA